MTPRTPKYTLPAIGSILAAAWNEDVVNPGATQDRLAIQRWLEAQARDKAMEQSYTRQLDYLGDPSQDPPTQGRFENWLQYEYLSGRAVGPRGQGDPDAPPPVPPLQFVVLVRPGEAGGVYFDILDGAEAVNEVARMVKDRIIDKAPTPEYRPVPVCAVPEYTKIPAPQSWGR